MTTILVLKSSILGDASASGQLVGTVLERLTGRNPGLRIVQRDLVRDPIPHLDADGAIALRGTPQNPKQEAALALSEQLVAELREAELILIGAPMYNFAISTQLKSWFDHVLRAGTTFRYTEAGPEGLLPGKRAVVVESRGGIYSVGPGVAMDAQEPHLRSMLELMGITDVTFVRAEKLAFGPEARAAAIDAAFLELEDALVSSRAA